MDPQQEYPALRAPKSSTLSASAAEFIPKNFMPGQQTQPQLASNVHQRFALAQSAVEPGGGDYGGGGYDYPASQLMAHGGPIANGGGMSALQNRLSNMQIGGDGGADSGKEFTHQQHHQPFALANYQQQQPHRGQHHGGHHGGYHQQQQQQQHHHQQQSYPYGGGYGNHHMNNHHQVQQHHGGGMPGEHRKYNNGGGGGGQHHRGGRGGQHHHYQQHQGQHHQHHHHHQQQHHHHQQQQHHHHQQQHQYAMAGGYNAMGAGSSWGGPMGGQDGGFDQLANRKSEALDYLTAVIAELFDNPGMFDQVKKELPTELGDLVHDQDVLSSAIEMIFEQSIQESNFRYMGARLCQLLDSLDQRPESLVRTLLHLKMEDLDMVALPEYIKQEQVKVRGAILFLAELYMQLRSPGQELGKKISKHIISAIEHLLQKLGPENVKCICQCLKLCGFELEQDCPDKVEAIMKKLEQERVQMQSSSDAMIRSVLDLRSIAWGRSEEIATSAASAVPPPPIPEEPTTANTVPGMHPQQLPAGIGGMGAVFYGPDGQVLTEEESSFLESNGFSYPANGPLDDSDEDEFALDEQDPEVREAYMAFLQSNRSNQLQQQQQQQQAQQQQHQQHLPGV